MKISRTDAIFEVYIDRIIDKVQTCDKALLWIFKQKMMNEFSVCSYNK